MNTKCYYLIVAFLATAATLAQAQEKTSYQAVVRAADNTLVTNQEIGMQISILQGSADGNAVYEETHTPTTNANGLVTIEIGTGNPTLADFSTIDWAAGSFFTKTQIDPAGGTSYTIAGSSSELLSVPYALYAKASGSGVTDLNALSDVSFENNSMYIGTKPATAVGDPKWNLAVGNDALQLNTSGSSNTAVGYYALRTNTLGSQSTAIGRSALYNNDDGESNTAIGNYALYDNTSGFRNTTSGAGGLRKNISGSRNTASGHYALRENTTGSDNTAIGYEADANANDLNNATAIGANAVVSASNTIQLGDTDVIAVITSGNITASSFTTTAGVALNNQSSGANVGDMQYWNGTAWKVVSAVLKQDATLEVTNGIPTWVDGTPSRAPYIPVIGTATSVPYVPTIGTAAPKKAEASVYFTAPGSNGGSLITEYRAISSPGAIIGTGNSSPVTVTGLNYGQRYTFKVRATNAIGSGKNSLSSNKVKPTTVPDAPTIGTATTENAKASVSFSEPDFRGGSSITGYTATSNPGSFIGTGVSSPIRVTGLTNGTGYTFSVTATNAVGFSTPSSASNSATPDQVATIGDLREGGIVFWVDPEDNTKGLVCALEDESGRILWYNDNYVRTDATAAAIGAGSANTTAIIEKQGVTETDYAAGLARANRGGGYTDWFLPSKAELNLMYEIIKKDELILDSSFNRFSNDIYWSSTEHDTNNASSQVFSNGAQFNFNKNSTYNVRAVRAF